MRRTTQQSGANDERDAIRAHLRRMKADYTAIGDTAGRELLESILDWLSKRAARYRSKAGGLGARGGR